MAFPSDQTRAQPARESGRTALAPPFRAAGEPAPGADEGIEPTTFALPLGTQLDEFEITGVIGEGGFGIVYAAYDHSLERAVALKEYMPGALATHIQGVSVSVRCRRHRETFDLGLRSFINEARLLARFDHPSLVKVYRFWEAHGTAYMVMPHYHGETLKHRLQNRATPPGEAWLRKLLAALLEALEVIHQEHVFHRDIAPDNILLLEDDVPVLLDFGAARRVIGDAARSLTVILKPGYAPLEQYAEVTSMKQGAWTDIYALAATVHFAIHGKPPEPAVARMVGDTQAPMVESARGRYSEPFLAAIDAALRVKPEERVQNVVAFRALLDAAAAAPAPAAHGPPAHRSRMAALAGALALAAALGTGGHFHAKRNATPPALPAPAERVAQNAPPVPAASALTQPIAATPLPVTVPAPEAHQPTVEPMPPAAAATPAPAVVRPPRGAQLRQVARAGAAPPPRPVPKADPQTGLEASRQAEPTRSNVQAGAWIAQAQQSLGRRDFRRALGFADGALALEPANAHAREIRRRAHEGEKRAFDEIKIE